MKPNAEKSMADMDSFYPEYPQEIQSFPELAKQSSFVRALVFLSIFAGGTTSTTGCISLLNSESQKPKVASQLSREEVKDILKSKLGVVSEGLQDDGSSVNFAEGDSEENAKKSAEEKNLRELMATSVYSVFQTKEVRRGLWVACAKSRLSKPEGQKKTPVMSSKKAESKIDIQKKLLKKLEAQYAGPQKNGSYVWFGEGSTLKKARNNAKKKLREVYNVKRIKEVAITVEMLSGNRGWIVGIRAVKEESEAKELPTVPEKHHKLKHKRNGTVHAWYPEHKGQLDEIIVFVHGYANKKNSVDFYWGPNLKLEQQFRKSGRNALFIAPQTQRNARERVRWKGDLQGLIDFVKTQSGIKVADNAKITVISHSGGYVTSGLWTNHPNFNEYIGSDTVYGTLDKKGRPKKRGIYYDKFRPWISQPGKKMTLFETSHPGSRFSTRYHNAFMQMLGKNAKSRVTKTTVKTGHQHIPRSIHKWLKRK